MRSGKYWFSFSGNVNSDTNVSPTWWSSNSETSGYTTLFVASNENSVAPATWSVHQIVDLNANTYIMVSSQGATNSGVMARVNGLIEYIPEDWTNITENITNNYINPSTQTQSILSIQWIFNGGGDFNLQSTTGYLCIQPSSLPYLDIWQQGVISLTQSPNNTTTSYFEVSVTGKYKVTSYVNWYVTSSYNS